MTNSRIILLGALVGGAVAACDVETYPDELAERDAILAEVEQERPAARTSVELAEQGISLLRAEAPVDREVMGPAEFGVEDLDDPRLTEPMRASLELMAASDPSAVTLLFTCPDNIQANVISFGGATAGWGSVGFVGGAVSSTSTSTWFDGRVQLKCHGTNTLTPGYFEPIYVSRFSAVGAECQQHSGGGDYWFTCQSVSDSNCCSTGHGAGCEFDWVESCVCAVDAYCCNTNWDSICVNEVTSEDCGGC